MATTTNLGLKTFGHDEPIDFNEWNDNSVKIDTAVGEAKRGKAAQSLTDNGWFVNPVNQMGMTENSANGNSYFIDRWFIYKGTAKVTNIGIQVIADKDTASFLCQYIKGLRDGTYTFAAKVNGNIVLRVIQISGTTVTTIGGNKYNYTGGYLVVLYANDDKFEFDFRVESGATITVEWAALYEGSYTADTLPAYVPKGYAAELVECKLHYRIMQTPCIPCANNQVGKQVYGYIQGTMRIAPTVICDNLFYFQGDGIYVQVTGATAALAGDGIRIAFDLAQSVSGNLAGVVGGTAITFDANM